MKQLTQANRLIIRIMTVLIIMSAVIMIIVYDVTRKSLVRETKSRYEAIILNSNEKALEVLMKHLLNNATQFTDKGAITVSCSEYNDKLHINVTDMGCGISPELREHIFDTFVEIGGSPKLNGLGLPICKAITKLCGGDIWIDTSYTEGARFIVEMPKNATLRERAQSADE